MEHVVEILDLIDSEIHGHVDKIELSIVHQNERAKKPRKVAIFTVYLRSRGHVEFKFIEKLFTLLDKTENTGSHFGEIYDETYFQFSTVV